MPRSSARQIGGRDSPRLLLAELHLGAAVALTQLFAISVDLVNRLPIALINILRPVRKTPAPVKREFPKQRCFLKIHYHMFNGKELHLG